MRIKPLVVRVAKDNVELAHEPMDLSPCGAVCSLVSSHSEVTSAESRSRSRQSQPSLGLLLALFPSRPAAE